MEFFVIREKLSKALTNVTKAVSAKVSLPILQNVLIEEDGGRLKLTATDLDKSIITWVGAKIEGKPLAITIPAKPLQSFISSLSDEQVGGIVSADKLKIQARGATATFNGISSKEYPNLDYSLSDNFFEIKTSILKEAIAHTYFSTSVDETKPLWTGILVKLVGDSIHIVGLDGFRLSKKEIPLKDSGFDVANKPFSEVVIPAKNLLEVIKLAGNSEKVKIDIQVAKNVVVFELEDLLFISKILEGEFPNYEAAIPKETAVTFEVISNDLSSALRSSAIFASSTNAVRLFVDTSGGLVKIFSDNVELGNNVLEIPIFNATGEPLEIGFNPKYIMDFINNVSCERILVKCSGQKTPAIFLSMGLDNYCHIAVPLQPFWEKS